MLVVVEVAAIVEEHIHLGLVVLAVVVTDLHLAQQDKMEQPTLAVVVVVLRLLHLPEHKATVVQAALALSLSAT